MGTVKVCIVGRDYKITSNEKEEYVLALAKALDKSILELMGNDEHINLVQACVLTALESFDEKEKISYELDKIRLQLKAYMDENATLSQQKRQLSQHIDKLEKENKQLWNNIQELKEIQQLRQIQELQELKQLKELKELKTAQEQFAKPFSDK